MNDPKINVTPLIDVLLVLLIIFMVITPVKPSRFAARVPSETERRELVTPDPETLEVTVTPDSQLTINGIPGFGTIREPQEMTQRLTAAFAERTVIAESMGIAGGPVQKTVFIKAPRATAYGDVAKVVDAVKASGADPISLWIDDLE
ncbi:MAG: ExbD/TolR family protein [Pyrinomonadaceae bacterium]